MREEEVYKRRKGTYQSSIFLEFLKYSNEQEVTAKKIDKVVHFQKDWLFLDIGAGEGGLTKEIAMKVRRTVLVEPAELMISRAKKRLENHPVDFIKKKAEDLTKKDFKDAAKFNLILLSHVLNNIKKWKKLLKFLLELKKKNGHLIIIRHAKTGDYRELLNSFFRLITGSQYEEIDIRGDAITSFLKACNCSIQIKKIQTRLVFSSEEEALSFSRFIFLTPLSKIKSKIKRLLLNYFQKKKKNNKITIIAHHEMIIAK